MKRLLRRVALYGRRFGQVEVMDLLATMRQDQHMFMVEQREALVLQQQRLEDALMQLEAILVTLALQQTEPPPPSSPPSSPASSAASQPQLQPQLQAQHAE